MSIQQALSACINLTGDAIDREVRIVSPGVYALGSAQSPNVLEILYVGRADDDVNSELKRHIGEYGHFRFAYLPSAQVAFEYECSLYHGFRPVHNAVHPARPAGADWACPQEGCAMFRA